MAQPQGAAITDPALVGSFTVPAQLFYVWVS